MTRLLSIGTLVFVGCGSQFGSVQPDVEAARARITPAIRDTCAGTPADDEQIATLIAALEADRTRGVTETRARDVLLDGCGDDEPCYACASALADLVFRAGS